MSKQIDAGELPLRKVFSSDYDFEIPDYQRPYAWRTEQALQLLDDLKDALDRADGEPYFLGSLVLVKDPGDARAQVIDGQQRLTTLTILFAILRDLSEDEEMRKELTEVVLEPGRRLAGTRPKPRLRLRSRDEEFFRRYVQEPGRISKLTALEPSVLRTDSQAAIRDNAASLVERLREWTDEDRGRLAEMLGGSTYLVMVSTPDLTSAHRIFSVMNSRGLDLSPADIFKARVIGAIPEEDRPRYADKWEGEEEDLGRDNWADLFLHIRTVVAKTRARKELLREFDEQVLGSYLPSLPKEFVDEVLVPYSDAYEVLLYRKFAGGDPRHPVNQWLDRLHQIDNNDWRPPALWALRHHAGNEEFLTAFLARLERLAASMLIRRVYATPRASRYADLLRQVDEQGLGLEAPAFDLSTEERRETIALLDGEIYRVAPVRRYVLLRLDETIANDPGVTYHHRLITVEHVLPQSPREGSEWGELFSDEEREYWTHRLANLVLLNRVKNSQAQNFDFSRKKSRYFLSGDGVAAFALTTQVVEMGSWTPKVLRDRQDSLMGILTRLWDLDSPD